MRPAVWGALWGLLAGVGLLGIWWSATAARRGRLATRVLAYVGAAPRRSGRTGIFDGTGTASGLRPPGALRGIVEPWLRSLADGLDRWLGGREALERRLVRAGGTTGVAEFRMEQVVWGLVGFAVVAALGILRSAGTPASWPVVALCCLVGFVGGAMAREYRLGARVAERERQVLAEFPTVAELLALAVAAGEGPVQALDRVVARSNGPLSVDLGRLLARVRTGTPVGDAFEEWGRRSGQPVVTRFARGVAVAVERGTPLADVLHAQVEDVREANRRGLIESAARREVAMMAPVVFLVLPTVILFAFFPGLVGLHLTTG